MTTAPATNAEQTRFQTNPFALASLVVAILAIVIAPFLGHVLDQQDLQWYVRIPVALIPSAIAIVLGRLAQRQLSQSPGRQTGGTYAYVGIAIGWLSVLVVIAVEYWYLLPDAPPVT
jgi:hypothetical protein